MIRPQLIIFAKAPVFGRAKTRLAKGVGVVHAKRLYRAMTRRILRNLKSDAWDIILAVTPPSALGQVNDWDGTAQMAQVSGSLSPRLAAVFTTRGTTLVIGTDSPQIRRDDILAALKALNGKTIVFGPATDGGFWLIGAAAPLPPAIFDNIRWSHEQTLADMERNCAQFGYKVHLLRAMTDIDDIDALRAYQRGED